MDEELMGAVKLFAGTFAPKGYMFCAGQTLSIAQNTALFSILGTTYGGDGSTTFKLPDLQNRFPMGTAGQQSLGTIGGSTSVTLTAQQMPMHTHTQQFANIPSTTNAPAGNVVSQITAADGDGIPLTASGYAPGSSALVAGAPQAIGMAGGSQPVSVMPPFLGMNYIICVQGIYPSRN